ncbi:lysophospholipid acyltransferase family protein [Fusobacterium sp.]|uniref:lysophospholipid acyltransferase family protein n=1 Tax=Fusobacterium sp. TaxID=68766 RepID=UPI000C701CC8|nr:lysophospholipid acyltransferase family protein [Fusobacterium sp.]
MLGLILVSLTTFFIFVYITVFYLPIIAMKDEHEGILLARKQLKFLSRLILRSLGVKLRVIYKDRKSVNELDRKKGIIYVCNHQSNFDIPAIITALHMDVGFVAKQEMKSWLFFNLWMKKSRCVFLDRSNPRAGIKSIQESVALIKKGYPIVIFPEGERSLTGEIGVFKKGSFKLATETNGVIVPITLKGTYNIQRRGRWVMKRNQKVTVVIDKPVHVDRLSREEIKNLSVTIRQTIIENYNKINS